MCHWRGLRQGDVIVGMAPASLLPRVCPRSEQHRVFEMTSFSRFSCLNCVRYRSSTPASGKPCLCAEPGEGILIASLKQLVLFSSRSSRLPSWLAMAARLFSKYGRKTVIISSPGYQVLANTEVCFERPLRPAAAPKLGRRDVYLAERLSNSLPGKVIYGSPVSEAFFVRAHKPNVRRPNSEWGAYYDER